MSGSNQLRPSVPALAPLTKRLTITGINCSRPWLHNLLEDYAKNRRVELPGWAAAAL